MSTDSEPSVTRLLKETKQKTAVKAEEYLQFFDKKTNPKDAKKKTSGEEKKMVNLYYDLVTDFYEYGWGDSFHFSRIMKGDTFKEAIQKHELYLAMKLALKPGETVLDLGCGVGGPARNIARFSKACVIGINNNAYQLQRAEILTEKANLSHLCTFMKGDFTQLCHASDSVEKLYACEATCHALVKTEVFAEIFRILKPGGLFANYDWVLTDKYDAANPEHNKIVHDIREGNGLSILQGIKESIDDLRAVGFDIIETENLALTSEVPWETPLEPSWMNLRASPLGRMATHSMLYCLEKLTLTPKGSTRVHTMLCQGADGLIKGAKTGIFTPMHFTLVRKPGSSD